MKKLQKRMLALVLSVVMVLGLGITSVAAPNYPTTLSTYLSSKSSSGVEWGVYVSNLKSAKSKISNVKSSKPALLKYLGYRLSTTTYHYTDNDYYTDSYEAYMRVQMAVGSAKLKFTADNTKCEMSCKVMNYSNPIKSITVKGLNSNKNFASKYKESNWSSFKLSKNLANPVVVVTPANGWKVTGFYYNMYLNNDTASSHASSGQYGSISYNSARSGQTSYKVPLTFLKKKSGSIQVNLINEKTGGTQTCYVSFQGE